MKLPPKRLVTALISLCVIIIGTYIAIQFGKGYRPSVDGTIKGTGLLAANSFPTGAEVYINDKLTTATDDTLNLTPATYRVAIKKDGYLPWSKDITVKEELVAQTNATLFKAAPGLSPLTLAGAQNITPSPDGQKIAYAVTGASSAAKNGLYVLEMNGNALSQTKEPRQISRNTESVNLADAILLWSPNSGEILIHLPEDKPGAGNYLINIANFTEVANFRDVTVQLPVILAGWEEEIATRETKQFAKLPLELQGIATQSAVNFYFSPSEEKVMYTSTGSATLSDHLIPAPPSTSSQPEDRTLEPNQIYVYDLIEDKNFTLGGIPKDDVRPQKHLLLLKNYQQSLTSDANFLVTPTQKALNDFLTLYDPKSFSQTVSNFNSHYSSLYTMDYQWYPNSTHLIYNARESIEIVEYDSQNRITVYSGPLSQNFIYPWPDGKQLIIVLNLNPAPNLPENLYAIAIR